MLVDQIPGAQEPLALPCFALIALLGPGFATRRVRGEVQVVVGRVCPVVRDSRVRALLVGPFVGDPPVVAGPNVFTDSEAKAGRARSLAPLAYNVAPGPHPD